MKLKTEKYCNEIIFKYVNSTVRPIFNEKVVEKCNLWVCEQCTNALFTVEKPTNMGLKKKKKRKTRISAKHGRVTLNLNGTLVFANYEIL